MRPFRKLALVAAVAALPAFFARSADATIFTTDVNIAGWVANGDFTDVTNTSALVPLAPGAYITGVQYINLNYDALGASFVSDFVLSTNVSTNDGAAGHFWDYSPSSTFAGGNSGTINGSFTNPSNQFSSGPFQLLPDGNVFVTVWDDFVDNGGAGEESVNSGTLRITWSDVPPPPPSAPTSIEAAPGGSLNHSLAPSQIVWYHFTWGGGAYSFNTNGSTLINGSFGDDDTEMGLYDSLGALINNDDDSGAGSQSLITGTLAAGEYYMAIGGFNTTFGPTAWNVSSTSPESGNIIVNGLSVVPEPGSLAVFALGLVVAGRRRR